MKTFLISPAVQRHDAQTDGPRQLFLFNRLIDLSAIVPDLAAAAGEGADVAHLHHRICEVGTEGGRGGAVGVHPGVGGASAEELLVGVEQPLLDLEVLEVGVVERGRAGSVER